AALDADPVARSDLRPVAEGELPGQIREVDPRVDGELQRSPEAAVHLHQVRRPGATVLLVLEHRDPVPAERPEQADRLVPYDRVDGHAFTQHAHAAGGRLLAQDRKSTRLNSSH